MALSPAVFLGTGAVPSQSGRSVERVKKHVVFEKVMPGWGAGRGGHRPGLYDSYRKMIFLALLYAALSLHRIIENLKTDLAATRASVASWERLIWD